MLEIKCPYCGNRSHELNEKFRLDRFDTGHLIDEKGVGTKNWIG